MHYFAVFAAFELTGFTVTLLVLDGEPDELSFVMYFVMHVLGLKNL